MRLKSEFAALRRERALALCVIAAVLLFYRWTVTSNSTDPQPLLAGPTGEYYNLLTDAFRHGHLYLDIPPDPLLLKAKNPFDASQRAGAVLPHDVSYYGGHFYIYYGVTPVVILRLPWRWVTGHDLPQNYAVLIFVSVGYLAAAGTWLALRRRYFPGSGSGTLVAGLAVLGFATMTHAVLRRSSLWEEPIAAGYCCAMLFLGCLYRARHSPHRVRWLATAGVCLGLAIGARPNYAVGAVALLVPVGLAWWQGRRDGAWRIWPARSWWRQACALGGGLGVILLGLAWYNFARFGSPLELGTSYMFTNPYGSAGRNLALRFFPFNAWVYYLAPAQWSRYFPFAKMIHAPATPAGYSGIEFAYGLLPNFPFVALAVLAPLAWRRRAPGEAGALREFIGSLAALYLSVGALLIFFLSATGRYMVDFTPALMLLACIGLLGAERAATGWRRAAIQAVGIAAAAFSVLVGLMLNFQLHDLLRQSNPGAYQRLASFFDAPVYAAERALGTRYGPTEITLRFPRGRTGMIESLVTTGWEYESDYLVAYYLDGQHLKLGFVHTNYPVAWSQPLTVDYGSDHRLQVQMGSLFPPVGHPFYAGQSHPTVMDMTRGLRVTLDGQPVFDARQYFYDGSPGSVHLGGDAAHAAFGPFTGVILARHHPRYAPPLETPPDHGLLEFKLSFPTEILARGFPLVVTGRPGRGDVLFVRFARAGVARFYYDHWGIGLWQSGDVPVAAGPDRHLRIRLPSLRPPAEVPGPKSELTVDLDGSRVWTAMVPFYPADTKDLYVGENGIGASSCEAEYPDAITRIQPNAATPESKP